MDRVPAPHRQCGQQDRVGRNGTHHLADQASHQLVSAGVPPNGSSVPLSARSVRDDLPEVDRHERTRSQHLAQVQGKSVSMYDRRERQRSCYNIVACDMCGANLKQPCQYKGRPARICAARRSMAAGILRRKRLLRLAKSCPVTIEWLLATGRLEGPDPSKQDLP